MNKEEAFHDYLKIKEMVGLNLNQKCRILSEYLGNYDNCWRVVGITEDALEVFSKNNFKKTSGMRINRSHIVDRNETYTKLLTEDFDCDTFWNTFLENDKTILSTSSENMSKKSSRVIEIKTTGKLFKSSGFSWRHTREESSFLKEMYEKEKISE
jgi:hypothetical protein